MTHHYYNKPEYEGYETNYRILAAIEDMTKSDITDHESQAYLWWETGGDEDKIIDYLDANYPDWRENDHLNWGDDILKNNHICEVCGDPLILDDGYAWVKTYDQKNEDYTYKCVCGAQMDDEVEYNADTGHYECSLCGAESPDLNMIKGEE